MDVIPPPQSWCAPPRTIVVCFSQRVGSNLLCSLMTATGVLGRPDHFMHDQVAGRLLPDGGGDVLARLALPATAGRSENGVVGFKLTLRDVDAIGRVADLPSWYPDAVYVSCRRRDLLGQAISLLKAAQTKQYRSSGAAATEAEYSEEGIYERMCKLAIDDARWRLFFARNGIEPVEVTYEALVEDVAGTLAAIAGRAGIVLPDSLPGLGDSPLQQQRDGTSDAWRRTFLEARGDFRRTDRLEPPDRADRRERRRRGRLGGLFG